MLNNNAKLHKNYTSNIIYREFKLNKSEHISDPKINVGTLIFINKRIYICLYLIYTAYPLHNSENYEKYNKHESIEGCLHF